MDNFIHQLPASSCASNIDSQSGNLFLLLLNTLFASQCALKNPNLYPPDQAAKIQDGNHFDFIVVGAGSAGSVVASRLAEVGKWKILVVEAGGLPSVTTEIPGLLIDTQLSPGQTWQYFTEPSNSSCRSFENGACYWPRGKVLGGSSAINGMLYLRGNKQDYNFWAESGNAGWDYENIKKYFKRTEKLLDLKLQSSDTYGRNGSIPLTRYHLNITVRNVILESAKQLGYNILEEEGPVGFFESIQNIKEGVRYNAAKILIHSSKINNKITLALNSYVRKILIDKNEIRAKGIEVKIGQNVLKIYADKEVILSAGAINSPQILMLSGVGPEKHLAQKGIEVIKNLKVGENLQDHIMYPLFVEISDEGMESSEFLDEIYKYFVHREGLLSNTGLLNVIGLINTKNNLNYADIQLIHIGFPKNVLMFLESYLKSLHLEPNIFKRLSSYNKRKNVILIGITLLEPKSRGKVSLRNANPHSEPSIFSGYLTDEKNEDMEKLLKGIRLAEAQLNTAAFRGINAKVLDLGISNCKDFKFDSDDYWKCAMQNIGTTLYHPTSTCKMGPKSDKHAVVESNLKVRGVKNLRVIDASIMPKIVRGNTQAAVFMIGQKGVQNIIEHHVGKL